MYIMNWIHTLDTSLEQFLPTKLVQDNQQYTAQECKLLVTERRVDSYYTVMTHVSK